MELREVTLGSGVGRAPLLGSVSLSVAAGEAVAIGGAMGSGKSALLHLMLGLVQPERGEVLIDGVPLAGTAVRRLRSSAALLPQRAHMFEGTLLQNLTGFGDEAGAEEDAMALSFLLGLDAMVRRLPDGYATMVGGRLGQRLSGGVRQRVSIIRALVGRPRLVLFDEANAGLDSVASGRLRDVLAGMKGQATLVMISGEAEFRAIADRRFVLADGMLSPEQGEPA